MPNGAARGTSRPCCATPRPASTCARRPSSRASSRTCMRSSPCMARTERPPNSARPAALTESSGFLLNKAAQRAVALGEEALQAFGVKPRHYGVLEAVSDAGPRSQQQIGHLLQIDRTTMAAVADDLERLGLAIRQPYP